MIDLHSHILPGLDDGPDDIEGSVGLARAAWESGTRVMVATPHIREDHPFPIEAIADQTERVNRILGQEGIPLRVVSGGEVALTKIAELDDDTLESLCLGDGRYLLVESPYAYAPELVERLLFELQARGYRPILAHPERSPSFLNDFVRLSRLVEKGVHCSVTALSMVGAFGGTVQAFTTRLFAAGMVHNVASDAHDERGRPPGLGPGFERLDSQLPGLAEQADWFTRDAPQAILAGQPLPSRPEPPQQAERGWRKLIPAPMRTA